jgi:ketosteroid isomerase-like protein
MLMKRMIGVYALSIVTITFLAACSGRDVSSVHGDEQRREARFDLAAMRKLIESKNDQFTRAHVAGDIATIDAMFTRDAKSLPPAADAVIGRAAIHELTVEYIKGGIKNFREETTDFYGDDTLLVDEGTYVVTYGADNVVERGKYLNVWKVEDGSWKIQTNIWNTNAPPIAAK